jgi:RHS repeat-associated protein
MKKLMVFGIIVLLLIPLFATADLTVTKKPKPTLTAFDEPEQDEPTLTATNLGPNIPNFPEFKPTLTAMVPLEIPEPIQDTPIKRFFYANNKLIAEENANGVFYYHQDRLSNRLITNEAGEQVAEFKSLPYGQPIINEIKYNFAGKELDESNLHNFGARYYNSNLGRFLSVDPVKTNEPYSYSKNNPITFYDPDGRDVMVVGKELESFQIEPYLEHASAFMDSVEIRGRYYANDVYNFNIRENILDSDFIFMYSTNLHDPITFTFENQEFGRILADTNPRNYGTVFNFKENKYLLEDPVKFFHTLMHEVGHQIDIVTNEDNVLSRRRTLKGAAMDELLVTARVHAYLRLDQPYEDNRDLWNSVGFSRVDFSRLKKYSNENLEHYSETAYEQGWSQQDIDTFLNMYGISF